MPIQPLRIALALCLATAPAAAAQTAPAFDVATVKPGDMKNPIGMFTFPGGRIEAKLLTLVDLIQEAYQLPKYKISGGPGWISEDRYDIVAKPPADSEAAKLNPASFKVPLNDDQRLMLQALLAERFQLKIRQVSKEGPVFTLGRDSKEVKMQPSNDPDQSSWAGAVERGPASGIAAKNVSMAQLALRLATWLGRPVIDQTGLTGSFSFSSPTGITDPDADVAPAVITSLHAVGLKLTAGKAMVDTIVVDHAEKPSAN
jgi:uncharacterized protein (TIGR03435 family)